MITFLRRKMRIFIYLIVGAFVLSLVAGSISLFYFSRSDAAKRHDSSRGGLDPNATEQPLDPSGLDVNSMKVAARITLDGNIDEITEGELNQQLKESEFFKRSGGRIPPEFAKFLIPQSLERLIKQRMLTLKADSMSVDVSAEVDKSVQQFYDRMGGVDKISKHPMFNLEELRKSIASSLKYQKLIQQVIGGRVLGDDMLKQAYDVDKEAKYKNEDGTYQSFESVKSSITKDLRSVITEKDILSYYETHKDRWKLPSKATFRRLMIDSSSDGALSAVSFTEAQLNDYYKGNATRYLGSKKYSVRHIFIDPASEEYQSKVSITEEEIKARYDENIDDYRDEEKVKSASILIKVAGLEESDPFMVAALKKADTAFQRILKGEDFVAVAKELSEDTEQTDGYWARGMKDKVTEETVFALSVGGFSKPVKTSRGIEIFKLIAKKDAAVQLLDTVKNEVKEQLQGEKAEADVLKSLNDISSKIRSKELSFKDAAKKYSQAPSSKFEQAGYVGYLSLGKNEENKDVDEIGEAPYVDYAIRNLLRDDSVGLYEPVQSKKGYHLVELLKVIPAGVLPLDKCKDKVEKDYRKYLAEQNALQKASNIKAEIEDKKITFIAAVEKYSTGSDKENGALWSNVSLSAGEKPMVDGKVLSDKILEESGSVYGLSSKIINAIEETGAGNVSRPMKIAEAYQIFFVEKKFEDQFESMTDEIRSEIKFALNPVVPVEELKAYFSENEEKYRKKAKVTVQHIMLADKVAAQGILKKALAGDDFSAMVQASSIDFASKKRDGTLIQENTPKQIAEAIKGLNEGDIAPQVIDSGVGFHVLKLVKRDGASEPVFGEVKEAIEEELLRPKVNTLLEDYVSELRNRAVVEIWDGSENPLLPRDKFVIESTGLTLTSPDLKPDNGTNADKGSGE